MPCPRDRCVMANLNPLRCPPPWLSSELYQRFILFIISSPYHFPSRGSLSNSPGLRQLKLSFADTARRFSPKNHTVHLRASRYRPKENSSTSSPPIYQLDDIVASGKLVFTSSDPRTVGQASLGSSRLRWSFPAILSSPIVAAATVSLRRC